MLKTFKMLIVCTVLSMGLIGCTDEEVGASVLLGVAAGAVAGSSYHHHHHNYYYGW